MTDISVTWDPATQLGVWSVANEQVETDDGLLTAVLISLFTDRALPEDQTPPDGSDDRRGWWADTYTQDPVGSLLWTLARAVKTSSTALLGEAQKICLDALQWMVTDSVAAAIEVKTWWLKANQMGIAITIDPPTGSRAKFTFSIPAGAS